MDAGIERAALRYAITVSAELEVQLTGKSGHRPMLVILAKAQREAAAAVVALTVTDPHDTVAITRLQNEVRRFSDLVRWVREIVDAGLDADQIVASEDQEELAEIVGLSPEDIAVFAGNGQTSQAREDT